MKFIYHKTKIFIFLLWLISSTILFAEDVPLPLELPSPAYYWDSTYITGEYDLETEDNRQLPLVPKDIKQLALNKKVNCGPAKTVYQKDLRLIVNGNKEAEPVEVVELRPKTQWIQIDLGTSEIIYNIVIWHFHAEPVVVHDVIVQLSNDPLFKDDVKTIFNNDKDNSSGLGSGNDKEYWDTYLGKIISANKINARYIRCYSRGSTHIDPLNRYTEIEVWGISDK